MEHRFFVVRVLVVIIGLFLFVIIINHTEKRPLKTTISVLDVGQGDSALIEDISGQKQYILDFFKNIHWSTAEALFEAAQ